MVRLSKRILVVDDELLNRCLLEVMLETWGYQIEFASNGTEALASLNPEIDLVLLDIMMPGLDGFEVTRRIRCGHACSDVPIIMVTGLSSTEDRVRAEQVGANGFVTKPIDQVELQLRMTSLLST
jgi:putative two-component system response regulator